MKIYITGHKSPDLDSIAAAVVYAEFLKESKRYPDAEIIPVAAGEINAETRMIFEKYGIEKPKVLDEYEVDSEDNFILVDHNEESQRHELVNTDKILEIVDHHKSNITFTNPVRIDLKPVGSTCAIIAEHYEMYKITPSKKIAELMLAAILSDTQGLKSSTTTGRDSQIAQNLAKQLKIEVKELTFDIFKAKSDITGLTAEEIAKKDYKVMELADKKVFINQVETVEPNKVLDQKTEMIKELENIKTELGVGQAYIIVTDILNVNSKIIYTNKEEEKILEIAFTAEGKDGIIDIGPKMSRKKDVVPAIEKVLKSEKF